MKQATRARVSELSDVLTISRGIPTKDTAPSGELGVLSVTDLRKGAPAKRFVDRTVLRTSAVRIPNSGDVLIALEGAGVGDSYVIPDGGAEFVPSQQVAVLRIRDRKKLDPWYLGAWLATEGARGQLRRLARGDAVQRIALKDLGSLLIPIWQFEKAQSSTAVPFRAFQDAIKAHRDIAECLESMCALMVEMHFGEASMIETMISLPDVEED